MNEWESVQRGSAWAQMQRASLMDGWAIHVVDEATQTTLVAYLDVADLAQLVSYAARELGRNAARRPVDAG